jgi:hypothetical protein
MGESIEKGQGRIVDDGGSFFQVICWRSSPEFIHGARGDVGGGLLGRGVPEADAGMDASPWGSESGQAHGRRGALDNEHAEGNQRAGQKQWKQEGGVAC